MKTFFYMGRNHRNRSGLSWKIWKISRKGRYVTTIWGAAELVNRRPKLIGKGMHKTRRFSSDKSAYEFEVRRIRSKESKGYERNTRWR